MRILHLISSGGMYGAEAVILNLSHAMERRSDHSVIASFANASRQMHERAHAEGLETVLVPCKGQFSPGTLRAIREIVTERQIDVVHAHGYKADLYAWAALRNGEVPLVSTCHTWYDNDLALRIYGVLDRRALRGFATVIAVSAEVEEQLLQSGVPAKRIRRIRNGIDLLPFSEVANGRSNEQPHRLRVGLVGRLAPEKGVDVFLEAATHVAKTLPDVEFVVVGEGPDRAQLEEQIRVLELGERLRLLGHQETMIPVYAGLDLLVSASRQEGLPVALLEGMASGLPVVGTTVGEVPTFVMPGDTGLLVAPGDSRALAAAMLQVLNDAKLRALLGRNARVRMEDEFSADRMVVEYGEVYRQVVGKGWGRV